MREHDLDSYHRKWRGTFGVYTIAKDERKLGTFQDFFEIERNILGVEITTPDQQSFRGVLEDKHPEYPTVQIEYHLFDSGWYPHQFGYALLIRKHVRGFSQGLSTGNHSLSVFSGDGKDLSEYERFRFCDFLSRPKFMKLDPDKPFGIMNERIWWKEGIIYFLNRAIGCFVGPKVRLEGRAFVPYIKPLLEEKCQIVS